MFESNVSVTLLAKIFCCKFDADERVSPLDDPKAPGMSDPRDLECTSVNALIDPEMPSGLGLFNVVSKYVVELLWGM